MSSSSTRRGILAVAGVVVGGVLLAGALTHRGLLRAVEDVPLPPKGAVVVAELFTSEGCSSCPPADDMLNQLVHQQLVAGVTVIGLGEHVDYWNRLGWSDPFSSVAFSDRQGEYDARVFHTNGIYTPQLILDGRLQAIGSDERAVRRAIAQAAQDPKATLDVTVAMRTAADVRVDVRVDVPREVQVREISDVIVALTEDHLMSDVRRGENGGRTLRHSGVVRSLTIIGALMPPMRALATTASVMLVPTWKIKDLTATAFLQERQSRRIIGAAAASVDRRASSS
jgi:hypothetical protein